MAHAPSPSPADAIPPANPPDHERNAREEDNNNNKSRIRIKNRRKRYLDLHPEYFHSADLELADPLLYDRLVRRFQSAEERELEGRRRGYTGVLEADLVRSEAKIAAVRRSGGGGGDSASSSSSSVAGGGAGGGDIGGGGAVTYRRAPDGHILAVERDEEATDKEGAWGRWVDVMTQRFLRGDDGDFEYGDVDPNEDLDDRAEEERRRLERYIDDQTPEFVGDGMPSGETGVQDF